ncbi:hypothetical protein DFJ63DRAFT_313808 [Scheffersomyces coipomensis]|uniref:uncharacterized protein n=1 Tax=Scheffersomyces coipomensis TaxID=1788519 RepID=UPI00315CAD0D
MVFDILLCFMIATSYVVFIYFHIPHHLQNKDRNDIQVITFRFYRITLLCVLLSISIPFFNHVSYITWIKSLNIIPGFTSNDTSVIQDLINISYSVISILVLFIGPILVNLFLVNEQEISIIPNFDRLYQDFLNTFMNIYGVRDYIFAPITEEFIFRGIILTLSPKSFINYTPWLFGIAHIHHGYHLYKQEKYQLKEIILTVALQLTYTTLFGYISNSIWFKYHNLWGNILVHTICNVMGLPELVVHQTRVVNLVYYSLLIGGAYHFITILF